MTDPSAFAGVAPTLEQAQQVVSDATSGTLWGVDVPGSSATAANIQGEAWFLIVSEEWDDDQIGKLGSAISGEWLCSCAADPGSDLLALGAPVAYLAAILGVQS
jgi:hypothetical protein